MRRIGGGTLGDETWACQKDTHLCHPDRLPPSGYLCGTLQHRAVTQNVLTGTAETLLQRSHTFSAGEALPFEPEAANLFFQLVSSRYERASLIVTSNKPFGRWGEVFGDDVVAAAMIDRLVHHAEVIALKGDSYRLKDRDLGRVPNSATDDK